MNWGKGIVVSFILFATFLAVMVTIMMRQDIGLVSKQYYREDLSYQEQYERKQNTENLEIKPEISLFGENYLRISFPSGARVEEGDVKLFRPSGDEYDQNFELQASSDSVQQFLLNPLERGVYRAKLTWKMEGKEYYFEKVIVH